MNNSPPDDLDHTALMQLWVLRAMQPDRIRKIFVRKEGFRDDDVARFLDLHDWIDQESGNLTKNKFSWKWTRLWPV